jgi:hypothetical protein
MLKPVFSCSDEGHHCTNINKVLQTLSYCTCSATFMQEQLCNTV